VAKNKISLLTEARLSHNSHGTLWSQRKFALQTDNMMLRARGRFAAPLALKTFTTTQSALPVDHPHMLPLA